MTGACSFSSGEIFGKISLNELYFSVGMWVLNLGNFRRLILAFGKRDMKYGRRWNWWVRDWEFCTLWIRGSVSHDFWQFFMSHWFNLCLVLILLKKLSFQRWNRYSLLITNKIIEMNKFKTSITFFQKYADNLFTLCSSLILTVVHAPVFWKNLRR